MEFKCSLETRTSKEGKPYEVVVIHLTDTLEKLVFLTASEKECLKYYNGKDNEVNPFNIK